MRVANNTVRVLHFVPFSPAVEIVSSKVVNLKLSIGVESTSRVTMNTNGTVVTLFECCLVTWYLTVLPVYPLFSPLQKCIVT